MILFLLLCLFFVVVRTEQICKYKPVIMCKIYTNLFKADLVQVADAFPAAIFPFVFILHTNSLYP